MMKTLKLLLIFISVLLPVSPAAQTQSATALPIFDAHLHYNIEAWEYLPPAKVFSLLQAQNVTGFLANSRPNEGSWRLLKHQSMSPLIDIKIVPFVRVYRDRADYGTWFQKPEVYAHIVAELDREPRAMGIGEFHLNADEGAHEGVAKIVDLAQTRKLWLHAHVDEVALRHILKRAPNANIIWAHTGFGLAHENVAAIMRAYPNVIGELSYRWDVASGPNVSSAWRALFTQFPDRFVLGSDTWVNQRWETYAETMAQYRAWLAQLPADVARKIAHENGERAFGLRK